MRTLGTICAAVGLFIIFPCSTAAQSSIPDDLLAKIHSSLVKITVEYIDNEGQTYNSSSGFGTRISPDGTILTAAHVALPRESELVAAVDYRIRLRSWDGAGQWRVPFASFAARDWLNKVTVSESVKTADCQRNNLFGPMPCLPNTPERAADFAVIAAPPQGPEAFAELAGPYDTVAVLIALASDAVVASDFKQSGLIELTRLRQPLPAQPFVVQATEPRSFEKGVSGSPLILYLTKPGARIFVIGIVVEQRSFTPDQREHQEANVIFTDEFLPEAAAAIEKGVTPPYNDSCGNPSSPLIVQYLTAIRNQQLQDPQFRNIRTCFSRFPTWAATSQILAFMRQRQTLQQLRTIATLSSITVAPATPQSTNAPIIDVTSLTRADDQQLRSFLARAYSASIDPLPLLNEAANRAAAACTKAIACDIPACPHDCPWFDLGCQTRAIVCERERTARKETCANQTKDAELACRQQRSGRLMQLADTILSVREGRVSAESLDKLQETDFGNFLLERERLLASFRSH